ncbi:uncharacterized protein LOC142583021 isoform X2 [Dermacentor variabilis]|uniref:uncharacterized protein LOC142583021 isoform X2 n=1 Tax=Dermacentor variabilis TaxID=34621 RepID=UPI003F5BFCF8
MCDVPGYDVETELQPSGGVAEGVSISSAVSPHDDREGQHMELVGGRVTPLDARRRWNSAKSHRAQAVPSHVIYVPRLKVYRPQWHRHGRCSRCRPATETSAARAVEAVVRPSSCSDDECELLFCCCCCCSHLEKLEEEKSNPETHETTHVWHLSGMCTFCYRLFASAESLAKHMTLVHRRLATEGRRSAKSLMAASKMRI